MDEREAGPGREVRRSALPAASRRSVMADFDKKDTRNLVLFMIGCSVAILAVFILVLMTGGGQ